MNPQDPGNAELNDGDFERIIAQRVVGPFADALPDRLRSIEQAIRAGDLDSLRAAAGRLDADLPATGVRELTDLAARVRRRLIDADELDQVRLDVEQLIQMCWRVVAAKPK